MVILIERFARPKMDEQQLQLKMVHVYVYKSKKYMDTQKIKTNIDAGHKQEKKNC